MAKSKKPKHIAIAGNIGAGKTTLTELLSKHYKWIPHFEDVDHNPYLFDFYEDMPAMELSTSDLLFTQPLKPVIRNTQRF
jgi:deoxyadenosine/deoxycytidine kinase